MSAIWRVLTLAAVALGLTGCGGGGSGNTTPDPPREGSIETRSVTSQINGTTYPLYIYLPPASAGSRAALPIVYALDGEARFAALVDIAETTRTRVIVVAIGNQANRNRDYVPLNMCTPDGGGQVAYLSFIRSELIPFVESTIGGAPDKRALLGHSHGGSFVFYALFAQSPGSHSFASYLASDASVGCMPLALGAWERSYSQANDSLPVRLHISVGGNTDNLAFAQQIQDSSYADLTVRVQAYTGGHVGMIPAAFTDAISFAFAAP